MSPTYSAWVSLSSPKWPVSSTSENPMTAFSGVRSSWDMAARNSDLCRLASSSRSLACSAASRASASATATCDRRRVSWSTEKHVMAQVPSISSHRDTGDVVGWWMASRPAWQTPIPARWTTKARRSKNRQAASAAQM